MKYTVLATLLCLFAVNANAAILVMSKDTGQFNTKTSILSAATSADTAGKKIFLTDTPPAMDTNATFGTDRDVEITVGATVTINSGVTLTINGPFVNNGTITGEGTLAINGMNYSGTGTIGSSVVLSGFDETVFRPEWLGAVPDNSTNNTAVFTAIEGNANIGTVYLSPGVYKSTVSSLKKHYIGPGSVQYSNGQMLSGTVPEVMNVRSIGRDGSNVETTTAKNIVIIGDSITYGTGVSDSQAWPSVLQKLINNRAPITQGDFYSRSETDRFTLGGSTSYGYKGPLQRSVIMGVNSTITFSATNLDFVGFWCQRSATAGSVEIYQGASLIRTVSCNGATANDVWSGTGNFLRAGTSSLYQLHAITAPVEITGIYGYHHVAPGTPVIQVHARGGYSSTQFSNADVLASIKAQVVLAPTFVLAIGTNDIYNDSMAISSAQFATNMTTIVNSLKAAGSVVLTVPLRTNETTYRPLLEPFDNYRRAVYQVARATGTRVIDLSIINFDGDSGYYQSDGIHPSPLGHTILADVFFRELHLDSSAPANPGYSGNFTLINGATVAGAPYGTPGYQFAGNLVTWHGAINVTGLAKTTVLFTLPEQARPTNSRIVTVPCWGSTTPAGSGLMFVETNGNVQLFDFTQVSTAFCTLDGVTYATNK